MINTNPTAILAPLHCIAEVVLQQYIDMKKISIPMWVYIRCIILSSSDCYSQKEISSVYLSHYTPLLLQDPIEWNAKNKPTHTKNHAQKIVGHCLQRTGKSGLDASVCTYAICGDDSALFSSANSKQRKKPSTYKKHSNK